MGSPKVTLIGHSMFTRGITIVLLSEDTSAVTHTYKHKSDNVHTSRDVKN